MDCARHEDECERKGRENNLFFEAQTLELSHGVKPSYKQKDIMERKQTDEIITPHQDDDLEVNDKI